MVRVSSRSGGERTVISADGTAIVMTVAGEGPPLLLVHGASASHRSWDGVTPFLAHEFEVFAMARRGRPPSGDAIEYALRLEVQDVIACVDAIGASTRVLGHSSGGLCALEAALATSKIERLVLYEPAMGLASDPTPLLRDLEALLAEGRDEEALLTFLRRATTTSDETLERIRRAEGWEDRVRAAATIPRELAALHEYAFEPDRFRALKVPTLLVRGEKSRGRAQAIAEHLAAVIPGAEHVVLDDQAHTAHLDAPAAFADGVLPFLR